MKFALSACVLSILFVAVSAIASGEQEVDSGEDVWAFLTENFLSAQRFESDKFRKCGLDALEYVNSVCEACTRLTDLATADAVLKGCCQDGCTKRFIRDNVCCKHPNSTV
ncbi:hypothetical protein QR680_008365 [Steinernema hermaphroditum]|uniref:Uncharacterized protein n=1 Tax=Steinernema hermaphroditum TaxID=289476 RepID=A0AA39IGC1_9BILA|nr:hypothetical protein QR680_008365 [Steinernema hermaphroditum]